MPPTPAWLAAVESVLNRGIERSQKAGTLAHRLDRTALGVHVEGVARIRIAVCGGRLALSAVGRAAENDADATIGGSPFALLELLRAGAGPLADRGAGAVRVSGNAEVAAHYRELFALARPDLEDELSRFIGDLPARRLSVAAQGALGWIGKLARTARENVAEYLQEESRDLVSAPEVDEFVRGVDALRDTAERVEARLARLERRLEAAP